MDDIDAREAYRQAIALIDRTIKWHMAWSRPADAEAIERERNRLVQLFPLPETAQAGQGG